MSENCLVNIENRDAEPKPFSLLSEMVVTHGTKDDWYALHHLHYKDEGLTPAPRFYACRLNDELVGVVVLSTCTLMSAPRHELFKTIKTGGDTSLTNTMRATFLNANFRRASRVVTDTLYRGVGVSYRMLNIAARMSGFRFIEIQSSMAKHNPFAEKAGFVYAPIKRPSVYDKGIRFFRERFEAHPADHEAVLDEFNSFRPKYRDQLFKEILDFYYANSTREKTGGNKLTGKIRVYNEYTPSMAIKQLQQLVFASPAYGVYQNPDHKIELPNEIPLSAFDLQKPSEALRVDLL